MHTHDKTKTDIHTSSTTRTRHTYKIKAHPPHLVVIIAAPAATGVLPLSHDVNPPVHGVGRAHWLLAVAASSGWGFSIMTRDEHKPIFNAYTYIYLPTHSFIHHPPTFDTDASQSR